MTAQPWINGPYMALDLETTGADPFTARVVTATVLTVGEAGVIEDRHWLVNPGVEIPAEASAIHGVTTERAVAEGLDARQAVWEIVVALQVVRDRGCPLVIFNANYDLTVAACEGQRHGIASPPLGPILDPLVVDRALDRWRPGKRKLADCCAAYGVRLDGAHSSDGDALAAARLAWRMAHSFDWLASKTLPELHEWQAEQHRVWAEDFEAYLRGKGRADVIEREWPVRRVPVAAEGGPQ